MTIYRLGWEFTFMQTCLTERLLSWIQRTGVVDAHTLPLAIGKSEVDRSTGYCKPIGSDIFGLFTFRKKKIFFAPT
jgi:hypothetical protein